MADISLLDDAMGDNEPEQPKKADKKANVKQAEDATFAKEKQNLKDKKSAQAPVDQEEKQKKEHVPATDAKAEFHISLTDRKDTLIKAKGELLNSRRSMGTNEQESLYKQVNLAIPADLLADIDANVQKGKRRTALVGLLKFAMDTLREQNKTLLVKVTEDEEDW